MIPIQKRFPTTNWKPYEERRAEAMKWIRFYIGGSRTLEELWEEAERRWFL